MFVKKNNCGKLCFIRGGLAIGVPGELRAYEKAYEEFGGGVPWRDLFEPTIRLCEEGYIISAALGAAIRQSASFILTDPTLRFHLHSIVCVPNFSVLSL